jgi:hypothetical protein|uniref:Glycosyltransferase 2-like domain-containing protein n=1 Tax=viral metagenome TaxID=1070528 RepID=A0A6C0IR18_9ZZZZ
MEVYPKDFCVLVASHISYEHRIHFLVECLESLVGQSLSIPIYVSMSFENEEIKEKTILNVSASEKIINCQFIIIVMQESKTPQMKHFEHLLNAIEYKHEWIMFCDDDDTYQEDRVLNFAYHIQKAKQEEQPNCKLIGVYEGVSDKSHREKREEYWSYCVHKDTVKKFYTSLDKYDTIIANKCCDVLFAEYLRRSSPVYYFIQLKKSFYNYRIEDNQNSITGYIQNNRIMYENFQEPPPKESEEWSDYIEKWNKYIQENKNIYTHDFYLRTLVGIDFDTILQNEFLQNYCLLEYMDQDFIEELRNWHLEIKEACNLVYDIPI